MTRVRRRILRPPVPPARSPPPHRLAERWQTQLGADERAFKRWMAKLKRAVHTLDRLQVRISRLKRNLAGNIRAAS